MLSPAELARYRRQLPLPELGLEGQRRLRESAVLVVGAGGLGSPAMLYLAAAGVGRIGIIDDDAVELHNLHRQIVHATPDVGRAKVSSAADAIAALNPEVSVSPYAQRLNARNAMELLADYDLVVDGSDNFATRYVVNDACAALSKPWVYGSVERFSGQVSVFGAPGGPCYRCVYPDAPAPGETASCDEIGVLGAVPGVIGSLQATEALKLLARIGEPLAGRLMQLDLATGQVRIIRVDRRRDCAACGDEATRQVVVAPRMSDAFEQVDVEPAELVGLLKRPDAPVLIDVREPWEFSVARINSATLVPLEELEGRVATLDRARPMVVYCHHGTRSGFAAQWLRAKGFAARNLVGGIDRWSRDIDPQVPRY